LILVLDACVLYPPSLRDVLLTLAAFDAFEVLWSDEPLDEVRRNVLADHPDIDPSRFAEHTLGAMRRAFPEAMTTPDPAAVVELDNDPKDRHVAGVALSAGASAVVTLNVKDFESTVLEKAGVEILTPGACVDRLLDDFPEVVVAAVQHLASRWKNPPRTPAQIAEDLAVHPTMAAPMNRLRLLLGS
jgi:hypothetical protein